MKSYDDFKKDLGKRESGSCYTCVNKFGYLGMWQFGKARLCDFGLMRKDGPKFYWFPGITESVFLTHPTLQDVLFDCHVGRLMKIVEAHYPLLDTEKVSGAIAVMHLLGPGGFAKFQRGVDGEDALGTKASDYYGLFCGYEIPKNLPITFDYRRILSTVPH